MRIAFYAPLKPPDHPVASGDRQMARALMGVLDGLGHNVTLASQLRSHDAGGNVAWQVRVRELGMRLARRYIRRCENGLQEPPELWFTYHAYHKSPDHLGPLVRRTLCIPYVIAECSIAGKQRAGAWSSGHAATVAAARDADAILAMTSLDREGLADAIGDEAKIMLLRPFLDTEPYARAHAAREDWRAHWSDRLGLDPQKPWLLAVAMMRDDVKRRSYAILAQTMKACDALDWQLVIAGDGPARTAVAEDFAWAEPGRVVFAGAIDRPAMPGLYAAMDLLIWPALREAYGVAMLEAQAAGLPVVAGDDGGVAEIVRDGVTGLLAIAGDSHVLANHVRSLLQDRTRRIEMGVAGLQWVAAQHDLSQARATIAAAISFAGERSRCRDLAAS